MSIGPWPPKSARKPIVALFARHRAWKEGGQERVKTLRQRFSEGEAAVEAGADRGGLTAGIVHLLPEIKERPAWTNQAVETKAVGCDGRSKTVQIRCKRSIV